MIKRLESEARRLAILKLLEDDGNYSISNGFIHQLLAAQGMRVSFDVLRAELQWLQDLQLVSCDSLAGNEVVTLRQAGLDVAQGAKNVPGIAKTGLL